MLKNFLYLDDSALGDYLSALEGGARGSVAARTLAGNRVDGKGNVGVVSAGGQRETQDEETITMVDTPPAQFERLLALAQADQARSGWVDVANPDVDLPDIGVGALIDIESDIEIPAAVKAFSRGSGTLEALRALQAFADVVPGTTSIDAEKLDTLERVTTLVSGDLVIVGVLDSTRWRLTGKLLESAIRKPIEEFEDYVRITGKVRGHVSEGDQKHLLGLPGLSILPRDKRREIERKGPKSPDDASWLAGPAVLLEILAIYR